MGAGSVVIDGSAGEGGGQILRSALALSLCFGRPLRMVNVRARRPRAGLLRQHLAALRAAAEVGGAEVEGAVLGGRTLTFTPREVRPGRYRFDIGSAGSTTLVLATVLPALLRAAAPSEVTLIGGTHNPLAPSFDFLNLALLPLLARMGAPVEATLIRAGFYPAGGGELRVRVAPARALVPLYLETRGAVRQVTADVLLSRLPRHIGEREVAVLRRRLSLVPGCCRVQEVEAYGPGNAISVAVRSELLTEVFTGFGERGVPAETVAAGVADAVEDYLAAGVPVGPHLADQLLLPLVLAGGGAFVTTAPTSHLTTNTATIGGFSDCTVRLERLDAVRWRVAVGAA